jgi:hypothetical protein
MIEKIKVVGPITATENGIILVREDIRIFEDGVLISEAYHRTSLTPGQSLDGQPERVVAHAQVAWTPEVIAAYQAQTAQSIAGLVGSE